MRWPCSCADAHCPPSTDTDFPERRTAAGFPVGELQRFLPLALLREQLAVRRNELRVDGERVFERARGRPELAESLVGVPPEHEQCRLRRRRQGFGREALEQ